MNQIAFFQPGTFWALLFIVVIILIHFLKRPNTVHLQFSTLRFFSDQALKSKKSRIINRILQLLVRCSLATGIVFIFSRPYNKKDPLSMVNDQSTNIKIWIDQTPSMSYKDHNQTIMNTASGIVDSLFQGVAHPSNITLYNHSVHEFVPVDRGTAKEPEVVYGSDFIDAFYKANNDKKNNGKNIFIVISDFQQPLTVKIDSLLKQDSLNCHMICIPLIPEKPYNYSIRNARVYSGSDQDIVCTVTASGSALEKGTLSASYENLKIGTTEVSVGLNQNSEATIVGKTHQGPITGILQLINRDPLQFDNLTCFSSDNKSVLNIVVVGDEKKNFVISAALKITGGNAASILIRNGSDITYDELDSAHIIILNSLNSSSEALESYFKNKRDETKLVICGIGTDDTTFRYENDVLSKILHTSLSRNFKKEPLFPVLSDTISELWGGFQSKYCTDVAIYNFCKNLPGTPILKLSDGSQLISRIKDSAGRIWILCGTSLGITDENNICETAFFVPLLDRLIRSVSSIYRNNSDPWIAGCAHQNPFYLPDKSVYLFNNEGKLAYTWKNQQIVTIDNPGVYKISPQGQAAVTIVVESDPIESIMNFSSPEIIPDYHGKVFVFQKKEFLRKLFNANHSVYSFVPWVIILLLLLLEVLLWKKETPQFFFRKEK